MPAKSASRKRVHTPGGSRLSQAEEMRIVAEMAGHAVDGSSSSADDDDDDDDESAAVNNNRSSGPSSPQGSVALTAPPAYPVSTSGACPYCHSTMVRLACVFYVMQNGGGPLDLVPVTRLRCCIKLGVFCVG